MLLPEHAGVHVCVCVRHSSSAASFWNNRLIKLHSRRPYRHGNRRQKDTAQRAAATKQGESPLGGLGEAAWLTLCSDGNQLDSLAGDELQSFVDVGDLVDSHLSSLRLG